MPDEKKIPASADEPHVRATATLIFISHDNRDADLAEAFSKLSRSVSAGVLQSFRSSDRKGSGHLHEDRSMMNCVFIASEAILLFWAARGGIPRLASLGAARRH
jgi:hypothetical protein